MRFEVFKCIFVFLCFFAVFLYDLSSCVFVLGSCMNDKALHVKGERLAVNVLRIAFHHRVCLAAVPGIWHVYGTKKKQRPCSSYVDKYHATFWAFCARGGPYT